MTEKQEETCENCGHKKISHSNQGKEKHTTYCYIRNCPCEKFTPKNHSPQTSKAEKGVPNGSAEGTQNQEEFNLSDKIRDNVIGKRHVKEFIRRLKERFRKHYSHWEFTHAEIDDLAGDLK